MSSVSSIFESCNLLDNACVPLAVARCAWQSCIEILTMLIGSATSVYICFLCTPLNPSNRPTQRAAGVTKYFDAEIN